MVYCHDETTGDAFLIIGEIEIVLKNNINCLDWIQYVTPTNIMETDIHGWFVINSILE